MYFVPHFGHAEVYETSIWTPCFQISAKTLVYGQGSPLTGANAPRFSSLHIYVSLGTQIAPTLPTLGIMKLSLSYHMLVMMIVINNDNAITSTTTTTTTTSSTTTTTTTTT